MTMVSRVIFSQSSCQFSFLRLFLETAAVCSDALPCVKVNHVCHYGVCVDFGVDNNVEEYPEDLKLDEESRNYDSPQDENEEDAMEEKKEYALNNYASGDDIQMANNEQDIEQNKDDYADYIADDAELDFDDEEDSPDSEDYEDEEYRKKRRARYGYRDICTYSVQSDLIISQK